MMDVERCQCAIGSRPILHDDGLPKHGTELVGDDAAYRVAGAAGAEHRNESDRPRRIVFGIKRRTEQCGYGGDENERKSFHSRSSRAVAVVTCSIPPTLSEIACKKQHFAAESVHRHPPRALTPSAIAAGSTGTGDFNFKVASPPEA